MGTMKNTTKTTVLLLLATTSARIAPAQADVRAQLTRAVVIEEDERDVARAAAEYRKVAAAATDAALRAEASLRLGSALLAMGKKDEARAALAPVAAAGGALAERAKAMLQDQDQDDPVFAARVREALALTRRNPDQGSGELKFLGRGVVPYLMQAIRVGDPDPFLAPRPVERAFLLATVRVLCELGGSGAAEGLRELARHRDVVVRRTCTEAFGKELAPDLVPAAHEFLADADAAVRRTALAYLGLRLDPTAVVRLMQDQDATVRDMAFYWAGSLERMGSLADVREAAIAAARAELAREAPVPNVTMALGTKNAAASEAGRALWLAALRHPSTKISRTQDWSGVEFPRNAHADEFVATAEAITARGDRDRLQQLDGYVRTVARSWDRAILPQALRLVRLGAFQNCAEWFVSVLQPEDVPQVLANLDVLPMQQLGEWFARQALPAAAWEALASALEAERQENAQYWLVTALLRTRADEGVKVISAFATTPSRFTWLARLLCSETDPTPAVRALLGDLVSRDVGATDVNVASARNRLFHALAKLGREEFIPSMAAAYRLGLQQWDNDRRGIAIVGRRPIPGSFAGKLVDACLAAHTEAFADAMELGEASHLAPEVYAVLCRHALSAPSSEQRQRLVADLLRRHGDADSAVVRSFYLAALRSDDDVVVGMAAAWVPPGGVPAEALPLLATRARAGNTSTIRVLGHAGDPQQAALLRELLAHADYAVRRAALRALADLQGVEAIDALLPLADDPDQNVRKGFVEVANKLLDRRFAPKLLQLLRDDSDDNRAAAQKALEAIEFFHTQTARWQRVLSDANLDAPSAAEALVKQATIAKDKSVRLVAIASLGTLKVPETLPVLIQWMQDGDAEIAAAAKAAVAKINGQ